MRYIGQHRDNSPRPACTCGQALGGPGMVTIYGVLHRIDCAIVVDRAQRLYQGVGGSR